jgi:hypothetical protein
VVFGLSADNILRIYETWGPSARTCVRLSRDPYDEPLHAGDVSNDASRFIANPGVVNVVFDALRVIDSLFSLRPKDESPVGRGTLVAEIATNRIEEIISYAAAASQAHERINFYRTISGQPLFKASTGQMFEIFVMSWLASPSGSNEKFLPCTPRPAATPPPAIRICAYGQERTSFFSSSTALKEKAKMDKPLCLLPTTSQIFTAVDAIILTETAIITVQVTVTISHKHSANLKDDFIEIKKSIPRDIIEKCKWWCHVLITDEQVKAKALRDQTLSDLPDIWFYSAVFDVGRPDITRAHVEAFDKTRVSGSRMHAIGADWGITSNALAKIVWTSTMSDYQL